MATMEDSSAARSDGPDEDGEPESLLRALRRAGRAGPEHEESASPPLDDTSMPERQSSRTERASGSRRSRPDINAAKERYARGELALDAYLHFLVEARRTAREQDIDTNANANATVDDEPDNEPDGEPAFEPPPVSAPETDAAPASVAETAGGVLGERFELLERIASGGTADVYRARDRLAALYDPEHSTVSLKVLHRRLAGDEELLTAILRAAAQLRSLHHPNIEQIAELHRFGDDYVIVSEWLDGESLAQRLDREGKLAADQVGLILTRVAAALEHIHAQGVAHGDIKPGNVFITTEGRVKLLDFGFCLDERGTPPLSQTAMPRGVTGIYASCEVLEGRQPSPSDDIYSVACMVYRMLAGDPPYAPYTQGNALGAEAESLAPARPQRLSRTQWRALQRGLAFRRADRPRRLAELVAPFTAPRKPRTPRLAALVAVLVLAAWAVWLSWPGDTPVRAQPPEARVPASAQTAAATPETRVPATAGMSQAPAPPEAAASATAAAPKASVPRPAAPVPAVPATPEVAAEARPPTPAPSAALATTEVVAETSPPTPAPVAAPPGPDAAAPAKAVARPVVGFARERVVVSESAGYVKLMVRAVGTLTGPVRLSVSAHNGSARVNEDFVAPFEEAISLTPGRPSAELLVSLVGDSVRENVEDFSVSLGVAQGAAGLATSSVMVVITDD